MIPPALERFARDRVALQVLLAAAADKQAASRTQETVSEAELEEARQQAADEAQLRQIWKDEKAADLYQKLKTTTTPYALQQQEDVEGGLEKTTNTLQNLGPFVLLLVGALQHGVHEGPLQGWEPVGIGSFALLSALGLGVSWSRRRAKRVGVSVRTLQRMYPELSEADLGRARTTADHVAIAVSDAVRRIMVTLGRWTRERGRRQHEARLARALVSAGYAADVPALSATLHEAGEVARETAREAAPHATR